MSSGTICMIHGVSLNKKGECDLCMKHLKENPDILDITDGLSLEDFDSLIEGDEPEY